MSTSLHTLARCVYAEIQFQNYLRDSAEEWDHVDSECIQLYFDALELGINTPIVRKLLRRENL